MISENNNVDNHAEDEFISEEHISYLELHNQINKLNGQIEKYKKTIVKLKKRDKDNTDFFANVSHELRTPINVILGAQQVMKIYMSNLDKKDSKEKIDHYMEVIKQNCYRLVRVVSNLIDITKMDAGYFELSCENCDVVSLIENVTMSILSYAENNGIEVIFDTDTEEKIMSCDPEKIERILLNLLSNAVKFTPKGGKIFVNLSDNGDSFTLSVRDTGIGIPKSMQSKIFQRYIQANGECSKGEGSGIGLSLVKNLVEMHDGTIDLKSSKGKGTEFIITLPVKTIYEKSKKIKRAKNVNVEKIKVEFSDVYK